ncbi:lipoate--protein ligase family protein [Candidatus Bathyarchaeota archaeon]|nr:lipoate--protein ligase family protein [Candidatus Bathyarchaeota archaeon]
MKRVEFKIPEGKLIAAEVIEVDGTLISVKITGDFFMHPESSINDLENTLKGQKITDLDETINTFFKNSKIQLIGLSPKDIIHVIKLSLSN